MILTELFHLAFQLLQYQAGGMRISTQLISLVFCRLLCMPLNHRLLAYDHYIFFSSVSSNDFMPSLQNVDVQVSTTRNVCHNLT
jgi:hypothetical protein